jgi:hypothetical protein
VTALRTLVFSGKPHAGVQMHAARSSWLDATKCTMLHVTLSHCWAQAAGGQSMDVANALCVVARLSALQPGADVQSTDEAFQRAVDIKMALLGPVHPEVPQLLHDTGCMLLDAGRWAAPPQLTCPACCTSVVVHVHTVALSAQAAISNCCLCGLPRLKSSVPACIVMVVQSLLQVAVF